MAALQARAFAQSGWTVLQIDLLGCGDSDGELADASWNSWVDDVAAAATWLRERFGSIAWLWGLRSGCLVAADAARAMAATPNMLFWQPVQVGSQYLQHLLRLRVAAQLMGPTDVERTDTRELRAQFIEGRVVEVAGYEVPSALALGLDAAELTPIPGSIRVAWFEVTAAEPAELSLAAQSRAGAWRRAGHRVETHPISGQPFWQTQEIAECPALIDATLAALVRGAS